MVAAVRHRTRFRHRTKLCLRLRAYLTLLVTCGDAFQIYSGYENMRRRLACDLAQW
jgi:hypothetical protein